MGSLSRAGDLLIRSIPLRTRGPSPLFRGVGVFLVIISLACDRQIAQAELDSATIDEWLVLFRNADQGIRNVEWKVILVEGELAPGGAVWELRNQSPAGFQGTVRKDVDSTRFLVEYSTVNRYFASPDDGDAPPRYIRAVGGASFDGVAYRQWQRAASMERDDPQEGYGEGLIDDSDRRLESTAFRPAHGSAAGLSWIPPALNVYPGTARVAASLASFLEEAVAESLPITIEESGDVAIIRVIGVQPPEEFPVTLEIHWHRELAGIVEQRWYYDFMGTQEVLLHSRMRLIKIDGRGFPEEVSHVEFNSSNLRTIRWEFSDFRVNRTLAESDFRVEFPENVHLVDHIHSRQYLTGSSAINEHKAVREYASRFSPGRAALEESGETSRPPTGMHWIVWVHLVLIGCLFVGVLARRALRRHAAVILLMACGSPSATLAESPVVPRENDAGAPAVGNLDLSRVSRCGRRATYFALEYLSVDYDPLLVDDGLPYHVDGASLAEIANVLEAYGLQIDLRKGVASRDLPNVITSSRIAIFPVTFQTGANHYFVVCLGSRKQVLVVDPPRGAYPFSDALSADALEQTNGCVLFVSRMKSVSREEIKVAVDPDVVDFGSVEIDGPNSLNAIHRRVTIRNDGRRSVAISKIVSSCGCARSDWRRGILQPGEQKEVVFSLMPSEWGEGQQSKAAFLHVVGLESPVHLDVRANGAKSRSE